MVDPLMVPRDEALLLESRRAQVDGKNISLSLPLLIPIWLVVNTEGFAPSNYVG